MIKPEDFQDIAPELGNDDVVKIVDEQPEGVDEANQDVMDKFIKKYGKEQGEKIYYATANKQDRNPENFHAENDDEDYERASREIEYGINPEIQSEEEGNEENVDVSKLKNDVQKFMDRIDLSQFKQVLSKINTPIEQAEIIAAFAERIGVPRAKLPIIIKHMKVQAENVRPKMRKSDLVENVLRKKI
jgi:hypothetical protein